MFNKNWVIFFIDQDITIVLSQSLCDGEGKCANNHDGKHFQPDWLSIYLDVNLPLQSVEWIL